MGVKNNMQVLQVLAALQLVLLARPSYALLPKYTKEVTITAVDAPVTITCTWGADDHGHKEITEVKSLEKGSTHICEEKSDDMGSWRIVRECTAILITMWTRMGSSRSCRRTE